MKCPACNHENRDGAKFCEECAAPLKRVCASCGAELRPTAKFCDECGATTVPSGARSESRAGGAHPARTAETADARKVVTVVFADLVGSTALHERVDAESARRLMERYYDALRAAVEEHGGTVVKLLGDGVMAAFGVPQVAEDDALRAVRAGMAMQDAFRALLSEQAASLGEVGLRVAVNTGEVVVSGANDDVVGDPVNVAARLQQEARDGDVVIGEATQRLVSTLVTLEPLGSFALKGRAESVKAYRVVSLERPAGASATPFVGREDELARITRVYDTAVATPAARLAVLLGSPGLGKSRLIDELARRQSETATVISAHCDSTGGATFAPLALALRRALHIDDGTSVEALRVAVDADTPGAEPDRARIVDGITTLLAGSPASPEETFFVVRRLLAALAKERPVVLVIDDLHWAEPLLLDLVEHLIQWGSGVPLLVLVGARPELRDSRSSLATPGGLVADVVTLSGLDAGAAMRLAANVIGAADLPAAVAAKVLATSEGNPLFVGELIRMLVQEGALERHGDRWTIGAGLAELEMPPTIHALLAARIERLRPEERIVLERAAVVGRQFSRSAVAELLPGDVTDLDARLEALRRSELIERDTGWFLGEPVLRFHHVLIRDAAYRRVLKGTRAELHARFADWIEARVGESVEHEEIIGWHLEQAHLYLGELGPIDAKGRVLGERAARYLAAAGRRALARDDLPLAASLLGRALARLDADDPSRADLALDWCEALLATGDVGPAAGAIEELGRFIADSERLRAWHTCFVGQLTVFTEPDALHATTEAVATAAETLTKLGDAAGEAKAHFVHAQALARLGKIGACEAALDRALAAARRAGDRRRANAVLAGAPLAALWGPSPVTRASGRCLDVVRVLRITQGAPAVEAVALSCQGVLEALRGRTDAARRMIASSRKMVEELGITHRLLEADVFSGQIDLLEGDAAAAERSLRGAYDGLRDLGLGIDAAQAAALLARALLAQGRAAEAESLSHESEALAGDDLKAGIAWRCVRAEALARRGEHTQAVQLAEAAVAIASATDALLDHADARLALAAALRAAGRSSEASAEERRATELWEAKGATLLAERARHGATRVEAPTQTREAREARIEPSGSAHRRVRPNAATAANARFAAAFAARERPALEATFASSMIVVDHPTESTYGRDGVVESFVRMFRMKDPRVHHEEVATLGESLALFRRWISASGTGGSRFDVGKFERDEICIGEADEYDRFRRVEIFAADRVDDAIARLYECYAELLPEGAARTRAATTARAIATTMREKNGGGERWRTACAPDAQAVDNRQLGTWNARGADAIVEQMGSLREVADGVDVRTLDILELEPDALLLRRMHSGTERVGGGAYERPFLLLKAFSTDGRVARLEFFDDAAEAAALARFHALIGRTAEAEPPRPVPRRIRTNAARLMWGRSDAAIEARDLEALLPLFREDYQEIDHPTGSMYGREGAVASVKRLLRSRDARLYHEPLATLGESLDLSRRRVHASGTGKGRFDVGDYESEALSLVEVDERGACVRQEAFAADRLGDAIARMYQRYAELLPEGPERERASMTAYAVTGMLTESKDIRLEDVMVPHIQSIDHRLVGYGAAEGTEFGGRWRDAWDELTQDRHVRVEDVLAATPDGLLRRSTNYGTLRSSGGAFESTGYVISLFGPDGRHSRFEVFDLGHEAEALARFDELVGSEVAERPATLRSFDRRVRPNAASAATDRAAAAFAIHDDASLELLFGETLEVTDHPNGATYGRKGQLDSVRRLQRVANPKLEYESLATLGESLALSRRLVAASGSTDDGFDVAEWQSEVLLLSEVNEREQFQQLELFAADQLGTALSRLYARYAELLPEGPTRIRAEATARSIGSAAKPFDLDRFTALFAPAVDVVDHRNVGYGALHGVAALGQAVRALVELTEGFDRCFDDVLGVSANALLWRDKSFGTDRRSGGAFERSVCELWVFGADGLVTRWERFDVGREAEALARFDELVGGSESTPSRPVQRRVRPNAATAVGVRLAAAIRARDLGAVDALLGDCDENVDHPTGARFGRQGALDSAARLLRVPDFDFQVENLATLGESLCLVRRNVASRGTSAGKFDVGEYELDRIGVYALDGDGRFGRSEVFASDHLADAIVRLYELRAEELPEGPARQRAAAMARNVGKFYRGLVDPKHLDHPFAEAIVMVDHRRVGLGTLHGVDAVVAAVRAFLELVEDAAWRTDDVLALTDDVTLLRSTNTGTDRTSGGEFERSILSLAMCNAEGRVERWETFEVTDEAAALARFDELTGATDALPVARQSAPWFANAATRLNEGFIRTWAARDWDAFMALHAPKCELDDRRRLMRVEESNISNFPTLQVLFEVPGGRWTISPIATRGERLALSRMLFEGQVVEGGGDFAIDYLCVDEVDADGLSAAVILFDLDDLNAAYVELDARFDAGEGALHPRVVAALRAADRSMVDRDWGAVVALHPASGFYFRDHRLLGWGSTVHDIATFVRMLQSLFDLAPDARYRTDHLRLSERGHLCLVSQVGTRDGGAFESPMLRVTEVDELGIIRGHELYNVDDFDQALARFAEINSSQVNAEAYFANAATRVSRAIFETYLALDWKRFEPLLADGFRLLDRRRIAQIDLDRSAYFAYTHELDHLGVRSGETEVLATRGESLCLLRYRFEFAGGSDVGASVIEFLTTMEADADGRCVRAVRFDLDDRDAAYAELDARYEAGEARAHPVPLATMTALRNAWAKRDWNVLIASCGPGFQLRDHRLLGWGTTVSDPAEWVRTQQALVELAPDVRIRTDHVRLTTRGWLRHAVSTGTRDGGAFELPLVMVTELDGRGCLAAHDLYDPERLDQAFARLEEIRAAAAQPEPRFANAATRSNERIARAWLARDWDAVMALHTPTTRLDDRRRLMRMELSDEPGFAQLRFLFDVPGSRWEVTPIATRGERLALSRLVFAGNVDAEGGALAIDDLVVDEVDINGLSVAVVLFDPDDVAAAYAELDARFKAGEGATHPPEPRFANAASRTVARTMRCFNARDWDGMMATYAPDHRMDDRRKLMRIAVAGEGFFDNERFLFEVPGSAWQSELVATRGERLALCRVTFTAGGEDAGPMMTDVLDVIEVDSKGRRTVLVAFDADDVDAAYAELDARFGAGEGRQYPRMLEVWRALASAARSTRWDTFAALCAPTFSYRDHRLLGWGTVRDVETFGRTIQSAFDLAPDARYRIDHVRFCERGQLNQIVLVGTRDGGAFENPLLRVDELDEQGRILHLDSYDVDDYDRALARFEEARARITRDSHELTATPDSARVETVTPNEADAALRRWQTVFGEALANGDWDAFRRICAPGLVFDDRRRLALLKGGYELFIAATRERVAIGARPERQLVATAGDRVAISRMLWSGGPADGRFEIEYLTVNEVDEAGQLTAIILFDCDDARVARREAWARWAAIDPVAAPWVKLLTEIADAWNARDRARVRAMFADDVVVEDHRRTGLGRIEGADAYVESNAVLWDLAPDQRIVFDGSWPAVGHHGAVLMLRREGTLADGGAFESEYVWLSIAKNGRITRLELFEPEDLERSLARFEELRPDPLRIPPNAATRTADCLAKAFAARDWTAVRALQSEDAVFEDRSKRSLVKGGVEECVAGLTYFGSEVGAEGRREILATAGERLALTRLTWRGVPDAAQFEIARLVVNEVNDEGRICATILFDADNRAAASAEMAERYIRSADDLPSATLEIMRAWNSHDLERLRTLLPADYYMHDRRRTGVGRLDGADAYVASLEALFQLSRDVRIESLYIALRAAHGVVNVTRMVGTNAEGGEFESVYVFIGLQRGARVIGFEIFEIEDLDAALARFEELRPDPLRIGPNAATRAADRIREIYLARDWDALRALAAPDFVYDDRGKRSLVIGDVETWTGAMQFTRQPGFRTERSLLAALGDHIALDRVVWAGEPGGDAFEFERIRLLEIGPDGRVQFAIFFDPEDRVAAFSEALERFLAGEAAAMNGRAAVLESQRAHARRDWSALRETMAPDFVFQDHRTLGMLGVLERDGWIASTRALVDMSPDHAVEWSQMLAWNRHGFVAVIRGFGTVPDGGPFENVFLAVLLMAGDLTQRAEFFNLDHADRALARFEELCATAGTQLASDSI